MNVAAVYDRRTFVGEADLRVSALSLYFA